MTTTAQEPRKLLRVGEVAERTQLSRWTIYRRIESGELPAIRLGSGPGSPVRVDADELERWLFREGE